MSRKLTAYQRGYLEAAIDFEGSLTVRKLKSKNGYSHGYSIDPRGYISNTNIQLLEKVQKIVGDGSIVLHNDYVKKKKNNNWKPAYKYQFSRASLRRLLPKLNLIDKERQKKLVLRALTIIKRGGRYYTGKRLPDKSYQELVEIVETIRSFNNRGLNAKWNAMRLNQNLGAEAA